MQSCCSASRSANHRSGPLFSLARPKLQQWPSSPAKSRLASRHGSGPHRRCRHDSATDARRLRCIRFSEGSTRSPTSRPVRPHSDTAGDAAADRDGRAQARATAVGTVTARARHLVAVHMISPRYPDYREVKEPVRVDVQFGLNADGIVRDAEAVTGFQARSAFGAAAEKAMRQWRFDPPTVPADTASRSQQSFVFAKQSDVAHRCQDRRTARNSTACAAPVRWSAATAGRGSRAADDDHRGKPERAADPLTRPPVNGRIRAPLTGL